MGARDAGALRPGPATLNEVLRAEASVLRGPRSGNRPAAGFSEPSEARAGDLQALYREIAELDKPGRSQEGRAGPFAALCISGGGIRSATFNLGVLQCLARMGLLGKFDYLSSVSGGGYIAGWLRTWMHREGVDNVVRALGALAPKRDPLAPEPEPVTNLREYSNYLTPMVGLFSGDTWAGAAIVARNLILNWLVLLPLLSAVIGIPLLFLLVARSTELLERWPSQLLKIAVGVELVASLSVFSFRRFAKTRGIAQGYFILGCVLPICLAAGMLATAALGLDLPWHESTPHPCCTDNLGLWKLSAVWFILVPLIGWSLAEILAHFFPDWTRAAVKPSQDSYRPPARRVAVVWEFLALVISGALGMALLVVLVRLWFSYLYNHPALYVTLALPLLLSVYLIARALFVGLASLSESTRRRTRPGSSDDADREWWARLSGWLLLVIATWAVVTALSLLGSYVPEALGRLFSASDHQPLQKVVEGTKWVIGALGTLSGLMAAFAGSSDKSPAAGSMRGTRTPLSIKWLLCVTGPLFIAGLVVMLSWGITALAEFTLQEPALFRWESDLIRSTPPVPWIVAVEFLALLLGLAVLALCTGRFVNVNRFSLHGVYRNRLVRAYLGASNRHRHPDPFTGFALDDNLRLHELSSPTPAGSGPAAQTPGAADSTAAVNIPPLSILNATLNLVHGEKLAWQQRKAESFSMTPLFCGSWSEGYRRSAEYGGTDGISVGTAIAISGAAANPNMGYSSSPTLGFLMAIFNVRLGAWLGNVNPRGNKTYVRTGPRQAIMPLFVELFGLTNNHRRYINLSDGGHFDNLGLYEVVLRRCRHVLVSDAGQDGSFDFEDLGNAIRKVRIDFGINIEFKEKIKILPNDSRKPGLYCAVGRIRYSDVDGTAPEQDGKLIYIKPTLRGLGEEKLPYDVYSYARRNGEFPHQSTADQWFSESQFESYRELGFHSLQQIGPDLREASFEDLYHRAVDYIGSAARESPDPGSGEHA